MGLLFLYYATIRQNCYMQAAFQADGASVDCTPSGPAPQLGTEEGIGEFEIGRNCRETQIPRSKARKPACSKCESAVSASVSRRSCIIANDMQSVSPQSLSGRLLNNARAGR
jgi:hypothetical protein